MSEPEWITGTSALAAWVQAQPPSPAFALDTEFVRERTFHPKLALLQLSVDGEDIALVDPLAIDDAGPLIEWLRDPHRVTLMHSAGEDLQTLDHAYGVLPARLFDTQVAAALVGLGAGPGYQRLVAELLGIDLPKAQQRSDWTRRPLSEAQRHYAADDVRHLPTIHRELERRLEELGRRDWLEQDCARLLAEARIEDETNPQLRFRGIDRLDVPQQKRLRRLLLWRDRRARSSDRPRGWILDNALATRLAQRPPADRGAFDALLDITPKAPRRGRDELFELLRSGDDEPGFEAAQPTDPDIREKIRPLQEAVAETAARLGIAEGTLCARRHLETLVETGEWPDALEGWRRAELEPALQPLLPAERGG